MRNPHLSTPRPGISRDGDGSVRGDRSRPGRSERPNRPALWRARSLAVRYPGTLRYGEAVALQEDLVRRRRDGRLPDTLLLLEHPHVITLGSSGRDRHVLHSRDELEARGIDLHRTGRGGDATYHGPGQLVGYPILDLKPDRKDLHAHLRALEEMLLKSLAAFGIRGRRDPYATGVWVGEAKVAAIGIRVSSGWITSHGFALNADTDLSYFGAIVPCGLAGRPVTSLTRLLGRRVAPREAAPAIVNAMQSVFGYGSLDDSGWKGSITYSPGTSSSITSR